MTQIVIGEPITSLETTVDKDFIELIDYLKGNSKDLRDAIELLLAHYRKYGSVMGMGFAEPRVKK